VLRTAAAAGVQRVFIAAGGCVSWRTATSGLESDCGYDTLSIAAQLNKPRMQSQRRDAPLNFL
jgi:hypothetical protein